MASIIHCDFQFDTNYTTPPKSFSAVQSMKPYSHAIVVIAIVMNVPRCLGVRVRSTGNSELGPWSVPRSKMSMGQRAWLQHGCCAPMDC